MTLKIHHVENINADAVEFYYNFGYGKPAEMQSDTSSHPGSNIIQDPELAPKVSDTVVVGYRTKKKLLTYFGLVQTADEREDDYSSVS